MWRVPYGDHHTDGGGQAGAFGLEHPGPVAARPAGVGVGVGDDHQSGGVAVTGPPSPAPLHRACQRSTPPQRRGVIVVTHVHPSFVVPDVQHPIADGLGYRRVGEFVGIHPHRLAGRVPFVAAVRDPPTSLGVRLAPGTASAPACPPGQTAPPRRELGKFLYHLSCSLANAKVGQGSQHPECDGAPSSSRCSSPTHRQRGARRLGHCGSELPGVWVDFIVQRTRRIGSPPVSGSTIASNPSINPGSNSSADLRPDSTRPTRPDGPTPPRTPSHRR